MAVSLKRHPSAKNHWALNHPSDTDVVIHKSLGRRPSTNKQVPGSWHGTGEDRGLHSGTVVPFTVGHNSTDPQFHFSFFFSTKDPGAIKLPCALLNSESTKFYSICTWKMQYGFIWGNKGEANAKCWEMQCLYTLSEELYILKEVTTVWCERSLYDQPSQR